MLPKVGDIIEANEDAPYAVTTPGTRWVVYDYVEVKDVVDMKIDTFLQVSHVPASIYEFNTIKELMGDSLRARNRRLDAGIKVFHVDPNYFEVVGRMGSNSDFKHLLSQGDIWKEEGKKEFNITLDDWIPF
jgi:hypothetical protein